MKNKLFILVIALSMSSCATLLGGQKTDHQRKPAECGQPRRQIRVGMVIADLLLFPPGLIIDFATRKIYKPFPNSNKTKKCNGNQTIK